jgi:membrane peptidoglycan carboxypeptidase
MALSWLNDPEPELPYRMRLPPALWLIPILIAIGLVTVIVVLARDEMQTSRLQSEWLSWYGARIAFAVKPGPNPDLRFPESGPYNQRLGYSYIPFFTKALEADDYNIAAQMRTSSSYDYFLDRGLYPLYHPKMAAGLTLYDRAGWQIYNASYPNHVFADYATIPPLLTQTLLFVENRELLKDGPVTRNPVIEWDRFFYASFGHMFHGLVPGLSTGGGSTLATQIEKFRFSPGGQTNTGLDKLRQIASASLRVYLDGPDTRKARERLVLDYLNGTPLSARPGFGEVNGIGDGLWAWFGIDLPDATTALNLPENDPDSLRVKAHVYRAALGLILAQRRPSYYLLTDRWALDDLTDVTLDRLANVGVVSPALRDAARRASFKFLTDVPPSPQPSLIEQKAVIALRGHLMTMLGLKTLYSTDRLDLAARSTVDDATERRVVDFLKKTDDPAFMRANGFYGTRMLKDGDDPSKINWSVVLYERGPDSNKMRIQADNLEEAFDMNEGMKLDLGSTAKLRTLVTYLEIMSELYRRYAGLSRTDLQDLVADAPDALTLWATTWLMANPDATMDQMLAAALMRTYSADPNEVFYTGGGSHSFANFEHKEDGLTMDLHEAFRDSVNCVFIRVMRDIVNYTIAQGAQTKQELIDDPDQPARQRYLERFAAKEGSIFLNRYIGDYVDMTPADALEKLADRAHHGAVARTVLFRSVRPHASLNDYAAFMKQQMLHDLPDAMRLQQLYSDYPPERYNLSDRGYIVGVNPLELWLVGYMQSNPHASRRAIEEVSQPVLIESYAWLFNPHLKHAQDNRIRIVLEADAFARIQKRWARLGYPFGRLVPSLATAIGSSADRPDALAELMGIIMNDGVKRPTIRFESLQFGEGTPYQTLFVPGSNEEAHEVLDPAIAHVMQGIMTEVVEDGTAKRVKGAYVDALNQPLVIGGKTGTGDQRYDEFGAGGRLISSHTVNRTGTFVFHIGDRYFGTIVAHVAGDDAPKFDFSSALAVQMLKALGPTLQPLISGASATAQSTTPPAATANATATAQP